jgi:methionine-S-sulfoxide reductase
VWQNPTYHSLGDQSETVEIDYDADIISYQQLLDIFWASHDATHDSWSRQYRSAVLYHGEAQQRLALETKARLETHLGKRLYTAIAPAGVFTLAEDYHQKYYLQRDTATMAEFSQMYPRFGDFVNSTAVARGNGLAGGNVPAAAVPTLLGQLGLSDAAQQRLAGRKYRIRCSQ